MEIKVLCDCGQKFKFDVEPVNGMMPFELNCPACNTDATPAANAVLAQAIPAPIPAPTPIAAPALRISALAHSPTPPPLPTAAAPARPMAAPRQFAAPTTTAQPKEFNMGLGILGAFIGAVVSTGVLFGISMAIGFRLPLFGTLIGAATGYGARLLYKGTHSTLGAISAVIAVGFTGASLYFLMDGFSVSSAISMVFAVVFAYKLAG